jgi:hypothetical protein
MLQEAGDEALAVDADRALAARVVGAHPQEHLAALDAHQALVADGRAVRVARQIVQHRRRPGQRRLRVDQPVVAAQGLQPLASMAACKACRNFARNTRDSARTGTKKVGERVGRTHALVPSAPSCNAPQAISACTCSRAGSTENTIETGIFAKYRGDSGVVLDDSPGPRLLAGRVKRGERV